MKVYEQENILKSFGKMASVSFGTALLKFPYVFVLNGAINTVFVMFLIGSLCMPISHYFSVASCLKFEKTDLREVVLELWNPRTALLFDNINSLVTVLSIFYNVHFTLIFCKNAGIFNETKGHLPYCGLVLFSCLILFILSRTGESLKYSLFNVVSAVLIFSAVISESALEKTDWNKILKSDLKIFESFALVLHCYNQQRAATRFLCNSSVAGSMDAPKRLILANSITAPLIYLLIGALGSISHPLCKLDWMEGFPPGNIKQILYFWFVISNLISSSRSLMALASRINSTSKHANFISALLLLILCVPTSNFAVESTIASFLSIFFISVSLIIIPSLIYLKTHKIQLFECFLIATNSVIAFFLILKSASEVLSFLNKLNF